MKEKDFLLSIVCPINSAHASITNYLSEVIAVVANRYEQYELILVHDGHADDLDEGLVKFVRGTQGVRLIKLMRNIGVDLAITAGLESAIGDVVVVCLPPFDPPKLLPEFAAIAKSGKIAIGQRPDGRHDFLIKHWLKKFFYRFANGLLHLNLPADTTYFVALPRQAVAQIQRTGDRFRFLKVITAQLGLPIHLVRYEPIEKDGRVYRSFFESIALSIDVISSQSLRPLRFMGFMSLVMALLALAYGVYVINILLFKDLVAPGWGSTSLFLSSIFFIFGLILAVVCEYLAKLFDESRNRPIYSIADEIVSNKVVANAEVVNVLSSTKA